MDFKTIRLELRDEIALLTLDRPGSFNGLTEELQREMLEALDQVAAGADARALIVTGAGKAFCSGADLSRIGGGAAQESLGDRVAASMEEYANPLILALRNLPLPVLAAVNGAAAGAGVGLALAADLVLAARSAFFVSTFLPRLGLVPDMGASWFLPQHLGRARALGLMLLGERLPAERAQEWGLVWACVDDDQLMPQALELAQRLARAPSHSALEARRALDHAARHGLAEQLDYEKDRQRELLDLPSFREGVAAFFEKREPVFRR